MKKSKLVDRNKRIKDEKQAVKAKVNAAIGNFNTQISKVRGVSSIHQVTIDLIKKISVAGNEFYDNTEPPPPPPPMTPFDVVDSKTMKGMGTILEKIEDTQPDMDDLWLAADLYDYEARQGIKDYKKDLLIANKRSTDLITELLSCVYLLKSFNTTSGDAISQVDKWLAS